MLLYFIVGTSRHVIVFHVNTINNMLKILIVKNIIKKKKIIIILKNEIISQSVMNKHHLTIKCNL